MKTNVIPLHRFEDVYSKLGWKKAESKSKKYLTWTHPNKSDIWVILPRIENTDEYAYFQDKNVDSILNFLNLEDTLINKNELVGQLMDYNYKLYNRFQNDIKYSNDYVPFEIAQLVPTKNVSAFRAFFIKEVKGQKSFPLENFHLSHTQTGSFVIPVSIKANIPENTLFPIPSETLLILEKYLKFADELLSIPISEPEKYAKNIVERGIDSRLVKDFLYDSDSIAKLHDKYNETVKELSIYSKYNPILDFNRATKNPIIRKIDINKSYPIEYEHILSIENLEEAMDDTSFNYTDVNIEVVSESVDKTGTRSAKFSVIAINGKPQERNYKARTQEIPISYLKQCAEAFISGDTILIKGDISKSKGKIAKIVVGDLKLKVADSTLFTS